MSEFSVGDAVRLVRYGWQSGVITEVDPSVSFPYKVLLTSGHRFARDDELELIEDDATPDETGGTARQELSEVNSQLQGRIKTLQDVIKDRSQDVENQQQEIEGLREQIKHLQHALGERQLMLNGQAAMMAKVLQVTA